MRQGKLRKVVLTSDWHLTNRSSRFRKDEFGVSDFLKHQLSFLDWLLALCTELGAQELWNLGDYVDYTVMDVISFNKVLQSMATLVKDGPPNQIILEGNHCIGDKANNHTILRGIDHVISLGRHGGRNIDLVASPCVSQEWDNVAIYSIPYMGTEEEMEQWIREFNEMAHKAKASGKHTILLFHYPTSNAILDNGIKAPEGFILEPEMVDGFTYVFGGDYHTYQQLLGLDNAWYVGSPFDLKFGEHQPRGVLVLDLSGEEPTLERILYEEGYNFLTMGYDEAIEWSGDRSKVVLRVNIHDIKSQPITPLRKSGYYSVVPSIQKVQPTEVEALSLEATSQVDDVELILSQVDTKDKTLISQARELMAQLAGGA